MREADTFVSAALSKLPGFSKDFRPRRDWAGDPITVHPGLWSNIPGSAANDEVNKLALQQGGSIGAPFIKGNRRGGPSGDHHGRRPGPRSQGQGRL